MPQGICNEMIFI